MSSNDSADMPTSGALDPRSVFQALSAVDDDNRRGAARPPAERLESWLRGLAGDPPPPAASQPTSATSEDLVTALRRTQLAIGTHARTLRPIVAALAAEGRRFAATSEGERWRAAIAASPLARRGRGVWEALSMQAFDGPLDAAFSGHLEAFLRALRCPELEALLAQLFLPDPEDRR